MEKPGAILWTVSRVFFVLYPDVPSLIFEFANIKPTKSGLTLKDD